MKDSMPSALTLWPRYTRPQGIPLTVQQVEHALSLYWGDGRGSGLARQGPDYYASVAAAAVRLESISIEDLGWAVLLAGRPGPAAAQSLLRRGAIDISALPSDVSLQHADDDVLSALSTLIWDLKVELHGIGIAIAVKMLHPKRPSLVPVLDGQNFFGSYQHPEWRIGTAAYRGRTARSKADVLEGLHEVRRVVGSSVNAEAWDELDSWLAPDGRGPLERVALFDMLWWALRLAPGRVLGGTGI